MKEKIELEYALNCSPKVLFGMVSTPGGLSEWFADDVNLKDNIFTFMWEGTEDKAKMLLKKDNKYIRYKWLLDGEDDKSYFEFKIRQDELTGDVALVITDFAESDEKDDSIGLWDTQISNLRHILGL